MEEREMGKNGKTKRCGRKVDSERGKWNRRRKKIKKGRKESFKRRNKERRVKDDEEGKAKKQGAKDERDA